MARNPALENATRIIAQRVGMSWAGPGPDSEVMRLAADVGMEDEIISRPRAVADEITAYLDDLVRNP
jgi:hypothetical protein